jgi:hypothetical protein
MQVLHKTNKKGMEYYLEHQKGQIILQKILETLDQETMMIIYMHLVKGHHK